MKIIKTKNICRLFAAAAIAWAANNLSGYNLFNAEDGGNVLCDIDPTCRKLNNKEIALAREFYGATIDYDQVKLFSRPPLFINLRDAAASARYGNIFLEKDTKAEKSYQAGDWTTTKISANVFVHEMAHVWQYQTTPPLNYFFRLAGEMKSSKSRRYRYDLDMHEDFHDYTIEQQAQMIQVLHLYRIVLKENKNNKNTKDKLCSFIKGHETKIGQALPINRTQSCRDAIPSAKGYQPLS